MVLATQRAWPNFLNFFTNIYSLFIIEIWVKFCLAWVEIRLLSSTERNIRDDLQIMNDDRDVGVKSE